VGKIGLPDAVLRKPGSLKPEEWLLVRQHPEIGRELVRRLDFLGDAAAIVLSHHERYDGGGYPEGLSGEEIPLGARIFAVVDTFDAVTSDRPYRRRRSYREAAEEIRCAAGSQLDPSVVAAFFRVPPGEWEELRRRAEDGFFSRFRHRRRTANGN
jgi:HD-GYP domain-containing protein (c-di-GMP phosphodiesterase class II)